MSAWWIGTVVWVCLAVWVCLTWRPALIPRMGQKHIWCNGAGGRQEASHRSKMWKPLHTVVVCKARLVLGQFYSYFALFGKPAGKGKAKAQRDLMPRVKREDEELEGTTAEVRKRVRTMPSLCGAKQPCNVVQTTKGSNNTHSTSQTP